MRFRGPNLLTRLKQKGYSPDDIPKAILFHEILGVAMLALTWSFCYLYPPSQSSFLQGPIDSIKRRVPQKIASKIAENGFLNSKIGSAYVESSCLRKLIRPLTLPAKIFLTFKFIEITSSHKIGKGHGSILNKPELPVKLTCGSDLCSNSSIL